MQRQLLNRRGLLGALLAAGAAMPAATASSPAHAAPRRGSGNHPPAVHPQLSAGPAGDHTASFQRAIDQAALAGATLTLPAGHFRVSALKLRPGTRISGAGTRTVLALAGTGPLLVGDGAHGLAMERVALDAAGQDQSRGDHAGLVEIADSRDIALQHVTINAGLNNGIVLQRCQGRIAACAISGAGLAALFSRDGRGIQIENNRISDCANNGILVWRTTPGEDATRVSGNHIERIAARAGGSGQNGNGVNVFRAAGVMVANNRITDCAYSAVRANAASNVQIIANSASRIGEVALYAEFAFEGAVIAQNIVDGAAAGISVTNFNVGGRLAVIQGNLIRNLVRREHEPVDKRGEGIAVEADASVTGNTIEGAPTAGIVIGWGPHMRDVAATGNVIRKAGVGILVTADPGAGAALIANNLISGASRGGVRLMAHGQPIGDELAGLAVSKGRIAVSGNVSVDTPS
ncbi:MAG: TIGR03808 family TAT-translocated repetitive protein [Hyphomicrobiaceae bacterium]